MESDESEELRFKSTIENFENCDLGQARMEPVHDRIHEKFEDFHSPVNFDDENIKILEPVEETNSAANVTEKVTEKEVSDKVIESAD